ncbi:MAG: hypothetical protein KDH96_13645, partial [Candidatus Riesia sp.]|nr:hypothetical protein [Candidatus Riesia sp.]
DGNSVMHHFYNIKKYFKIIEKALFVENYTLDYFDEKLNSKKKYSYCIVLAPESIIYHIYDFCTRNRPDDGYGVKIYSSVKKDHSFDNVRQYINDIINIQLNYSLLIDKYPDIKVKYQSFVSDNFFKETLFTEIIDDNTDIKDDLMNKFLIELIHVPKYTKIYCVGLDAFNLLQFAQFMRNKCDIIDKETHFTKALDDIKYDFVKLSILLNPTSIKNDYTKDFNKDKPYNNTTTMLNIFNNLLTMYKICD